MCYFDAGARFRHEEYSMKGLVAAAAAALLLISVSGAAMAQGANPAKADTADPNSAPGVKATKASKKPAKDAAAKANTADPGSAPGAKPMKASKKTAKDSAAKANTADPNSTPGK
jgi:hypothetical protein